MIDKLYSITISFILNNCNDEYADELKIAYMNYLQKTYSAVIDEKISDNKLNVIIKLEKEYWDNKSQLEKLSLLITDVSFNNLNTISTEIFNLAREKMINKYEVKNKPSKEEIDKMIASFKELTNDVYFFNEGAAKRILSETILDYLYVFSDNDVFSLRLGKIFSQIESIRE